MNSRETGSTWHGVGRWQGATDTLLSYWLGDSYPSFGRLRRDVVGNSLAAKMRNFGGLSAAKAMLK